MLDKRADSRGAEVMEIRTLTTWADLMSRSATLESLPFSSGLKRYLCLVSRAAEKRLRPCSPKRLDWKLSGLNLLFTQFHLFLWSATPGTTLLVIILFALLKFWLFTISGAEVVLLFTDQQRRKPVQDQKHAAARRIISLLEEPKEVLCFAAHRQHLLHDLHCPA